MSMGPGDKALLLKDLSARLPYGVMCACDFHNGQYNQQKKLLKIMSYTTNPYCVDLDNGEYMPSAYMLDEIRPYLRSMSSMTERERSEYNYYLTRSDFTYVASLLIDWLNERHFDYHGLIGKGLALESPKDMYKKNNY